MVCCMAKKKNKPNNTGKWSLKREWNFFGWYLGCFEKWKMEARTKWHRSETRIFSRLFHSRPSSFFGSLKVKAPQDKPPCSHTSFSMHRDLVLVIHIRSSYLSPSLSWSPLPQWWPECGHHTSRRLIEQSGRFGWPGLEHTPCNVGRTWGSTKNGGISLVRGK